VKQKAKKIETISKDIIRSFEKRLNTAESKNRTTEARLKEVDIKLKIINGEKKDLFNKNKEIEKKLVSSEEKVRVLEKKLKTQLLENDPNKYKSQAGTKSNESYSGSDAPEFSKMSKEELYKTGEDDRKKIKELEVAVARLEICLHRGFSSLWSLKK